MTCRVICICYTGCGVVTGTGCEGRTGVTNMRACGWSGPGLGSSRITGSFPATASPRVSILVSLIPSAPAPGVGALTVHRNPPDSVMCLCSWPLETALLIWLERTIQFKCRLGFCSLLNQTLRYRTWILVAFAKCFSLANLPLTGGRKGRRN